MLALPALIAVFATHFIPQIAGSWYAFTDWNGFSAHANWVGLRNFRTLLHDPTTRGALWHTLELSFAFVVIVNLTGLGFALGLNRTLKSRHVLRALLFAPVVVSPLAIAFIWQYIFDYYGALNRVLGDVGLSSWQQSWLGDPQWALWTMLVVMVWQFTGLTMVIYLAGLQAIPDELDEAAAVDGARHRAPLPPDHPAAARTGGDRECDAHDDLRAPRLRPGARPHRAAARSTRARPSPRRCGSRRSCSAGSATARRWRSCSPRS